METGTQCDIHTPQHLYSATSTLRDVHIPRCRNPSPQKKANEKFAKSIDANRNFAYRRVRRDAIRADAIRADVIRADAIQADAILADVFRADAIHVRLAVSLLKPSTHEPKTVASAKSKIRI